MNRINLKGKSRYLYYLEHQDEFCNRTWMATYKKYFLEEQNNKCAICGMVNVGNDKPITFILDHIDGDASNNHRNNLRLVCPNCDSQLDTYKSKNKKSARRTYTHKNDDFYNHPDGGKGTNK